MFRLYWYLRRKKKEVPWMGSQKAKLIIFILTLQTCKLDKNGKKHR